MKSTSNGLSNSAGAYLRMKESRLSSTNGRSSPDRIATPSWSAWSLILTSRKYCVCVTPCTAPKRTRTRAAPALRRAYSRLRSTARSSKRSSSLSSPSLLTTARHLPDRLGRGRFRDAREHQQRRIAAHQFRGREALAAGQERMNEGAETSPHRAALEAGRRGALELRRHHREPDAGRRLDRGRDGELEAPVRGNRVASTATNKAWRTSGRTC